LAHKFGLQIATQSHVHILIHAPSSTLNPLSSTLTPRASTRSSSSARATPRMASQDSPLHEGRRASPSPRSSAWRVPRHRVDDRFVSPFGLRGLIEIAGPQPFTPSDVEGCLRFPEFVSTVPRLRDERPGVPRLRSG
jgi:hypothetical protein